MESKLNVVAVVVTYNRKDLLMECLEAILHQSYKVSKILVIDNHSTDGTHDLLKERGLLNSPAFDYRYMDTNLGGAGGFNLAMQIANREYESDWIWIMDDDTIPTQTCLEELCNSINVISNENISYLASSIFGPNNECMNVPTLSTSAGENGYLEWYRNLDKCMVEINTATFVSLLINSKAMDQCGYPCAEFFIWGDDTEYTKRITKHFGPAYMVGKSVAIHKRYGAKGISIHTEDNKNRVGMFRHFYRNALIIDDLYSTKKAVTKRVMRNIAGVIKIFFSQTTHKALKAKAILAGTFEFIREKEKYKQIILKQKCVTTLDK